MKQIRQALAGLAIGQVVMIGISLCAGDGRVLPVPHQLALQTLAVMLYGCC